jgi:GntR family transcriptional regulator, transcriptional repressor for pyruvate dehydrogenase complex
VSETPALSGVFERVSAPTTLEETVGRLGTAVRLGVLAPGTRLPPERELAEQLGISRSTLRQALKALTETGHLVATRGRTGGTFVADSPPDYAVPPVSMDYASWKDFFDGRLAIELGAAYLAAERATAHDVARLEGHNETMRASRDDWSAYRRGDAFFHLAIAEAARSPRLIAQMTEIHGQLNELLAQVPHPEAAMDSAIGQHEALIEAIRDHDAAAAADCMAAHVAGLRSMMEAMYPRAGDGRFAR